MKRGLAVLDGDEVSADEFRRRIDALRDLVREAGLDGALVYGDVSRSDDLAYLTNLCLYWNEAVLLVPVTGEPVLLTKLSPRVHGWMHETAVLSEVRSTKDLAEAIATCARESGLEGLAVVERDVWPGDVVTRARELAPSTRFEPWGSVVRQQRSRPSPATLSLLRQAGRGLAGAIAAVDAALTASPSAVFSLLDRHARRAGFADVLVESAPGPHGLATRVAGQYRYVWVAAARTWLSDDDSTDVPDALVQAYRSAAAALRPGVDAAALGAVAERALGGAGPTSCNVACIHHADLSTLGDVPRSAGLPELPVADGSVVALFLEVVRDGADKIVVGDTYHVTSSGAECLTSGG